MIKQKLAAVGTNCWGSDPSDSLLLFLSRFNFDIHKLGVPSYKNLGIGAVAQIAPEREMRVSALVPERKVSLPS